MNERITVERLPGKTPDTVRIVVRMQTPTRFYLRAAEHIVQEIRDGRMVLVRAKRPRREST